MSASDPTHLFPLRIGRFCAIAAGVRFLLGGNHVQVGPSTFPFTTFPGSWREATLDALLAHVPTSGDTVVGNDVWIGRDVLVLPGVVIGDGAILAAGAVVTSDVEPYGIAAGNPARLVRRRYDPGEVARLVGAAWWDWPIAAITAHAATLMTGTVDEIVAVSARQPGKCGGAADGWPSYGTEK